MNMSLKFPIPAYAAITISALLIFTLPSSADAVIIVPSSFSFEQNLKQGSINPDVMYLQNILNASPNTMVAETGPGSDANLTSSFGSKTKDAVMRFQNIYAAEVLTPAGLTSATGIVGPLTRAKLNQVLKASLSSGSSTYSIVTKTTPTVSAVTSVATATSSPKGSIPYLISGSPASSSFLTQVVVLKGKNFTSNNTVQTNLGSVDGIYSADGTSLTFTIGTLPYYERAVAEYKGKQIRLIMRVRNENGLSLEQVDHILNLPASGNIADASPKTTGEVLQSLSSYQQLLASSTAYNTSTSTAR